MVTGTMTNLNLIQLHHYLTDENRLNDIYKSVHSLSGIIAPSEFKSYEELKEKLDRVSRFTRCSK